MLSLYQNTRVAQWWWPALFVLLCLVLLEHGSGNIRHEYSHLNQLLVQLETSKRLAIEKGQELRLQLNSQSDRRWIELKLMEGLGLVPEGQTKVFFSPEFKTEKVFFSPEFETKKVFFSPQFKAKSAP